jgi:thiamine biosynthesis lipoprotein
VAVALHAMATRFELVMHDDADPARLRAAGEEALAEIAAAEARWSRYRPTSEIAWVNARAGREPVRVSVPTFRLLGDCARLATLTEGAFDPTVGPLLRFWGLIGGQARPGADLARARALVGMQRVELFEEGPAVRLPLPGMDLDLGAIGKGAAIDAAIAVLREHGVRSALLHGGTSSVHTLGGAPGGPGWTVGWRVPGEPRPRRASLGGRTPALAVSAPHGRSVVRAGRPVPHVVDPRTGEPAGATPSVCVRGSSSSVCDALATALVVLGHEGRRRVEPRFPGCRMSVALGRPTP